MSPLASLALKYRPSELDHVIGQPAVVAALRHVFANRRIPNAVMFTGPSGVGKTTLARIVAAHLNAHTVQIDATVFNGVESMRQLVTTIRYHPLGREHKVIILEECHGLSAQAWQTLLLPLEEPPSWVYWLLATTEPAKVPVTVITRCRRYALRPVARTLLLDHLRDIAAREGLTVDPAILELCAAKAHGSIRQGLVNLESVAGHDRPTARQLLRSPPTGTRKKNGDGIVEMVRQGRTRAEMAELQGVDRTTIYRRLQREIAAGTISADDIERG